MKIKRRIFCDFNSDLFWSIEVDYDLYGESLIEHLYLHLFNVLDEDEANELANRISQWTSEL